MANGAPIPSTFNFADLWEAVAARVPERTALVCGDRRLTYAEVEERANRLAHPLAAGGVGPGDHVGLFLRNGTEYLEAMLAAFKLRAAPVNVNYRYQSTELRELVEGSGSVALLWSTSLAEPVGALGGVLDRVRAVGAVGGGGPAPGGGPPAADGDARPPPVEHVAEGGHRFGQ